MPPGVRTEGGRYDASSPYRAHAGVDTGQSVDSTLLQTFSHPDFTVGPWIRTRSCLAARGLMWHEATITAGRDLHPAPKVSPL